MNEERDSVDLIRDKDAAYLQGAGSFILKADDRMLKAQSIYAKNDISGNDAYEVALLNRDLSVCSQVKVPRGPKVSEASCYVSKILNICHKKGYRCHKIDFMMPLPLQRKKLARGRCIVLGEKDDYYAGKRGLLAYGLQEDLLICSDRKEEMNSVLNTLKENGRRTVLISSKPLCNEVISDHFSYEDREDLLILFEKLKRVNEETTLVIEDLFVFLSYADDYADLIVKLMKQKESTLSLILFSREAELSYRILNCFRKRILIGSRDMNEISFFFGSKTRYKGKAFYEEGEVISFVPVRTEAFQYAERRKEAILPKIPEEIRAERKEDSILIGYDQKSREKVFAKDPLIVSYDEDLLKKYRDAYGETVRTADPEGVSGMPEELLWLGPGIFFQHLFVTRLREDLKEEEGIYLHKGKRIMVRCINA